MTRPVKIALRGGIVETNRRTVLDQGVVLRMGAGGAGGAGGGGGGSTGGTGRAREALRYVEVVAPEIQRGAIFTLPADILIEDVHSYAAAPAIDRCTIRYTDSGRARRLLPILLRLDLERRAPAATATTAAEAAEAAAVVASATMPAPGLDVVARIAPQPASTGVRGQAVPYFRQRPELWLVYWYCWSLLALLGVQAVAAAAELPPDELFLSVAHDPDDADGMLAMIGRALAQVLGADWLTGSQGLRVGPPGSPAREPWRLQNAAASLYTQLPKEFIFTTPLPEALPRLAIVAVSSRKSDSLRPRAGAGAGDGTSAPAYHRATVYGESVGICRTAPTIVSVQRLATFTSTYDSDELYLRPTAILDQFTRLYEAGYRHILYIARAPYSNRLHLTRRGGGGATAASDEGSAAGGAGAAPGWEGGLETGEGLFFLSPAILTAAVEGRPDLRIYPVFRDQYAAMRLHTPAAQALYIQDTAELLRVADDAAQQMAVFLNLFSGAAGIPRRFGRVGAVGGAAAGQEEDPYYHGVVSYATLLNAYGGIVAERDLREALIHDAGGTNTLKDLMVLYLSLFHLARYQVATKGEITLKLDPFEEIIGDGSVGRVAVRQHVGGALRFNYLSFLAEVRSITHDWAGGPPTPSAPGRRGGEQPGPPEPSGHDASTEHTDLHGGESADGDLDNTGDTDAGASSSSARGPHR